MPLHRVLSIEFIVHRSRRFQTMIYDLGSQNFDWGRGRLGFTLIEFLVVLGVLAVTVGSVLLILTSVLRGTNQANITAEVKQNGQAVLDSLETQIRNAKEATDLIPMPAGATDAIKLTLAEGTNLSIACFPTAADSNGSIKLATSASPSYTPVTNQDLIAGVDVTDCSLSVIPASSVNPAIVSVAFVISQGKNAPSRQDFKANLKFATTISLRRY